MRLGILRKASRAAIKERRWPASRFPECKQPDGNTKAAKGLEWSTSVRLPGVSRGDRQGARVAPPRLPLCGAEGSWATRGGEVTRRVWPRHPHPPTPEFPA